MTVCIAAICKFNDQAMIIGASDRMLTSGGGDVEFEPSQTKIFAFTKSVIALVAGDASVQSELCQKTLRSARVRLASDTSWLGVDEAAQMYSDHLAEHRRQVSETKFLKPLSLSTSRLLDSTSGLPSRWVNTMTETILDYHPDIATLVIGIDEAGAHICHIGSRGIISSMNSVGFAAIGIGASHAESQFMVAKHSPHNGLPETLLLTYTAKRRAEAAPGVGLETDMVIVSGLGNQLLVSQDEIARIRDIHSRMITSQQTATINADEEIKSYLAESVRRSQETAGANTPDGGSDKTSPT